jgi:glucose-1-phosphate thymidylyltransferase
MLQQTIRDFVEPFESDRDDAAAQILLCPVPDPHRFGVAELDDAGRVVQLVEKPEEPKSNLALVGVYLFDRSIHEAVRAIEPSDRGELEITDAIQWLVDQGRRVNTQVLQGWWIDTGKLTPLLEANRLVLETLESRNDGDVDEHSTVEGRVVIEPGARIERSRILGPVVIGAGARVVDSYIGPYTAIASDCEILDAEIEHTVVCERSRVEGVPRIVDSLIGRDVEVFRTGRRPKAVRLMLGDHSQLDLA